MNDPEFFVKAKTLERHYKQQKYVISYLPPSKHWRWDILWVETTRYGEDAKSMHAAQKAAEKHIDKILSIKGKS